ncbi:MAG: sulfatase-like hydrolase/transferase [Roseovarius sp.]|uniref:sulfatase-like hydrolase/transferase n=1 Tax=Sphingomonadales TaxID=204457 RepID=UPI001E32E1F5|nr:sulfatase-like hydrolase/transferase [Qipengyuania citrea]
MALLVGAGYLGFQQYKIYLPGIIGEWREPIAENRPISWAQGPAVAPSGERPPNVILIVADDLGMNDISLYGGGVAGGAVPTPNIDSIARQGVSFANGYAANATCSPSRAALMTGRYPTRFGFEFTAVPAAFASNLAHSGGDSPYPPIYHEELNRDLPAYADMGVPNAEIMLPEALKAKGYHNIHIGKWHLGEAEPLRPTSQGFDESLCMRSGGDLFMAEEDPQVVNAKLPWDPIDRFLWANLPHAVYWGNSQRFRPKGHLTDYFTDNALAAIEANKNRPFFMYLAYNAPHTPLQALKSDYDALPQIKDHTQRVYGAMIRQLDRRIGDVMQKLKDTGLDENTLVIFTSDNGGAWYTGIKDHNTPYRGYKGTFFEGGIHVPMMMRWPGKIAPGTVRNDVAQHLDMFATIAAATGANVPGDRKMDSFNLLAAGPKREITFWRSGDYRVVRAGDWKLQVSKRPDKVWLFNLAIDPTEQVNLAAKDPARVAELRKLIAAQNAGLPKPLWPGLLEGAIRIDVPLNAPWKKDQEYVYWAN